VGLLILTFSLGAPAQVGAGKGTTAHVANSVLAAPPAIHEEHKHLLEQLEAAIQSGGSTGSAAKMVQDVLLPHFRAEEAYALPPLGLLDPLARGQSLSANQVRQAIHMADQLRRNYSQMIHEHQEIHKALEALASTARAEHKQDAVAFAEQLMLHANNEEQVLYPATLLIGKYLQLLQAAGK
jgi:hypothetical protein